MSETTLRAVLCPCCKQLLYALEPDERDGWRMTPDSPAVATDRNGPFIKCRRCSRRIAMLRMRDSYERGEPPYSVAGKQPCDQILS